MAVGLIVPVMSNFKGLTQLFHTVDIPVVPIVMDNWTENHGVSKAWNVGMLRAVEKDCEAAVIVNDDVWLTAGTLSKTVESLSEADLVSAVNHIDEQEGLYFDGFPDYSCFAIKPHEFMDKFGLFDENFSPAFFEDNDMHYRIKLAGGKSALRLDAPIVHTGSVTQNMGGNGDTDPRVVSHEMFEANRAYYTRKWGGWPRSETFTAPFNDPTKNWRDW